MKQKCGKEQYPNKTYILLDSNEYNFINFKGYYHGVIYPQKCQMF